MDREAAVGRFRALFREHQQADALRDLPFYLRVFAGLEDEIRAEYARLTAEPEPREEAVPSVAVGPDDGAIEGIARRLGPYRLLRELGRGGQGQVFLAEDTRLEGRRVAIKVLGASFHPEHLRRFRREAIAASRLDHPGICTVYEANETDGAHYIAMRYVDGESLAQIIAESREATPDSRGGTVSSLAGPRSRGQLFDALATVEKAARALHEAHEAGLVHRDIKPGNIMIDAAGEPVLLDFGLAHDARDEDAALTVTGELLGTPVYMSPEQLRGERLDRRTDVYSLGATLYECLTLQRPFNAPTLEGLVLQVHYQAPPDPARLNPHISRDVCVVLQTALEKDRNRRYQTALELAEELHRIRMLMPIHARPIGYGVRLRRWVQRNPGIAALSCAVLIVLVVGLVVSLVLLAELAEEQGQTQQALRHARAVGLSRAAAQALERDSGLALLLARRAAATERSPEAVGALYAALPESRERTRFEGHRHGLRRAVFSPDEQRVATASLDGTVRLWRIDGTLLATMRHQQDVTDVSFSPQGDTLLTASWDGAARLWNARGEELVRYPGNKKCVIHARFSPGGDRILTACYDGHARLFEVDGTLIREFHHDGAACVDAVLSPDGSQVVTGAVDGVVRFFRTDAEEPVWKLPQQAGIAALAFAPDGGSILIAPKRLAATLHALDGSETARFAHTRRVIDAQVSPNGSLVLTAAQDDLATVWTPAGRAVCVLPHPSKLLHASFAADGKSVFTVAEDNVVRVWAVPGGRLRLSLRGHSDRVYSVAGTRAVDRLLTSSDDLTARLWDVRVPEAPTMEHVLPVVGVAFDPAGGVATISGEPWVRFWNPHGEMVRHQPHDLGSATCLAYARNANLLAAGGNRPRVVLWKPDGEFARSIEWEPEEPGLNHLVANDVRLAPDGTRVLVACGDYRVRAFRTADGEVLGTYRHEKAVMHADFLPDGRGFVSGLQDGAVLRWDLATGAQTPLTGHRRLVTAIVVRGDVVMTASLDGVVRLQTIEGRSVAEMVHERPVSAAAYSPQGDRVASATDRTVRLWSAAGELLATFRAHLGTVSAIRFSPDGTLLCTGSTDGSARLWPVYEDELLRRSASRATRQFTEGERATYAALLPPDLPSARRE